MLAEIRESRSFADLYHRLGRVPLERVRVTPPPGTATVKDIELIRNAESLICELVDGALVEKPLGLEESFVGAALIRLLGAWVALHHLGYVSCSEGGFALARKLIRMPDVAFISKATVALIRVKGKAFPRIAPDLVVEVLSASNTKAEMKWKRQEYFAAGAKMAWEIDPKRRTAKMYDSPKTYVAVGEEDLLEGGELLKGFTVRLGDLFVDMDEFNKQ